MTNLIPVVHGDNIDLLSEEESFDIARQRAREMLQKLAEDICSVQPMNSDILDGLMFPIRHEPKS